jgi:hypothetical protein
MGVRSLQTPLDPEILTLKKKTTKRQKTTKDHKRPQKDHKKTTKRGFFYHPPSYPSLHFKNLKMPTVLDIKLDRIKK